MLDPIDQAPHSLPVLTRLAGNHALRSPRLKRTAGAATVEAAHARRFHNADYPHPFLSNLYCGHGLRGFPQHVENVAGCAQALGLQVAGHHGDTGASVEDLDRLPQQDNAAVYCPDLAFKVAAEGQQFLALFNKATGNGVGGVDGFFVFYPERLHH